MKKKQIEKKSSIESFEETPKEEKKFHQKNPIKLCECGCGSVVKNGGKFARGHSLRTEENKEIKRKMWKINNPMFDKKNRKYGDSNPSKREEVRKKISENNPMKNEIYRKKAVENRAKVGYKKTIELNKTLWDDKELLERRVKTYCENLANGKIKLKNNWKCGTYINKNGKEEWYDSSYELKRMEYYDNNDIIWTKKHGIRIPYVNEKGNNSYYVPDFLINEDGVISIEEIKGWIKKSDVLKAKSAIEYCMKNNLNYKFYLGKNLILNEDLSYIKNK